MKMRSWTPTWLLVGALSGAACIGQIGATGDDADGEQATGTDQQALCADAPVSVPRAPMRRLTRREYNNAIRDLLDDNSRPADSFVPDEVVAGFAANSVSPVTELQLTDYLDAAETLAARALTQLDTLVACDVAQRACIEDFVATFGRRAFRRPVDADLTQRLLAVYDVSLPLWGGDKAFELVLQTMLASPHFIYHVEAAPNDGATEIVALDPYELASRLSFFLWQSIPDDTLLAAAADGMLTTPEGVADQARRMLADDRASESAESFFGQWLEIEDLDEAIKSAAMYPEWSAEMGDMMKRETLAFTGEVMREGTLSTLLTASYTYGDAALATLYGAEAPAGAFGRIELDPKQRAGLLTQGSFLAGRAGAEDPSWVYRGKFVRENLLCETLPPPPPGVDMNTSNDPDRLVNVECKNCHLLMDPIGYGFEAYDALGRFDPNAEAAGQLNGAGDLTGPFDDPVELSNAFATSDVVRRCVATSMLRFAARRATTPDDRCSVEAIDAGFADADLSMRELLVAIVSSDAFRFRRTDSE